MDSKGPEQSQQGPIGVDFIEFLNEVFDHKYDDLIALLDKDENVSRAQMFINLPFVYNSRLTSEALDLKNTTHEAIIQRLGVHLDRFNYTDRPSTQRGDDGGEVECRRAFYSTKNDRLQYSRYEKKVNGIWVIDSDQPEQIITLGK